jgi:UDP-3-O-[3-hydroxymyristoyl] glucosamine N-acyltransferase
MQFTATQIASIVNGKIIGDANASVANIAKIEEAQSGDLCFLSNIKYENYLYTTQATIALVNESLPINKTVHPTLIVVVDAYAAFATLLGYYEEFLKQSRARAGIEANAFISQTAKIAEEVYIGANAYISAGASIDKGAHIYPNAYIGDNAQIGANTMIMPGVIVYHDCKIGSNCIIHAGVVIGADGFGFARTSGIYNKIPQIGNVVIEDDVEIGANTTIDRATMGSTFIRKGVKLDNLVQVAHNVDIDCNTVIAAQAGISGSTKIGKGALIGGQAGIVGHIKIADGTMINAQSGISKAIETPNTAWTGSPAGEYKQTLKSQVVFKNLPKLQQQMVALQNQIDELQKLINGK